MLRTTETGDLGYELEDRESGRSKTVVGSVSLYLPYGLFLSLRGSVAIEKFWPVVKISRYARNDSIEAFAKWAFLTPTPPKTPGISGSYARKQPISQMPDKNP